MKDTDTGYHTTTVKSHKHRCEYCGIWKHDEEGPNGDGECLLSLDWDCPMCVEMQPYFPFGGLL